MTTATEKTLGELAAGNPAAAPIFEKFGLDYCCGGRRTLAEACREAGVSAGQVAGEIDKAAESAAGGAADRNWTIEPLAELMAHIRDTHHEYTRAALARLGPLFEKVCSVHGANHPELTRMWATFSGLSAELTMHLMKEERMLFPYIERMEEALAEGSPVLPPPFGTVRNPIAMMASEHDSAGEALRAMRSASRDYTAPRDACASFRALYRGLADLEADLHRHIHLENNILFPRAIGLERQEG